MAYGENENKGVFEFMAGMILFTVIFTAASILIGVTLRNNFESFIEKRNAEPISSDGSQYMLIIDPGHGGEDGGCSAGNVVEKDLNLSVGESIYEICRFMGVPAKMTRTEDVLLYDMYGDLSDYTGKKKAFDLKNRLRFATEEGTVYLGIHMNKFPQSQYSGLQVYYSPNHADSKAYADKIKEYNKEYLQPENAREVKKATSSIYILSKAQMPAVLVECGFLSNDEELSLLCDGEYRKKLALEIFCAVAETDLHLG